VVETQSLRAHVTVTDETDYAASFVWWKNLTKLASRPRQISRPALNWIANGERYGMTSTRTPLIIDIAGTQPEQARTGSACSIPLVGGLHPVRPQLAEPGSSLSRAVPKHQESCARTC